MLSNGLQQEIIFGLLLSQGIIFRMKETAIPMNTVEGRHRIS